MAIRDEKEVKGIQTGKHVQLPFLADYMVLYRGISKKNARKLLEFISLLSKFAGYKIYTQGFLSFLYTSNERTENEIKGIYERNQILYKQMKGYTIFFDGKNKYCENIYIT